MKISVVIPSFNHAQYIEEAILSAVDDPYVDEVVVSDDCSADATPQILRAVAEKFAKVRLANQHSDRRLGPLRRLQYVVRHARNEWIAILNSDDRFAGGRFGAARPFAAENDVDLIAGIVQIEDEGSAEASAFGFTVPPKYRAFFRALDLDRPREVAAGLASMNFLYTTSNFLIRRSWLENNGFRAFDLTHDWDLALRAALAGRFRWLDAPFTVYRKHSRNTVDAQQDALRQQVHRMFVRTLAENPDRFFDHAFMRGLQLNPYIDAQRIERIHLSSLDKISASVSSTAASAPRESSD